MIQALKDFQLQKKLLWWNGLVPALMLAYDWSRGNLGANPPEAFIRTTGVIAILFLAFTLATTPASQLLGWSWAMKHRRWLGLWAFYYACLHLIAYSVFDRGFNFSDIMADIQKRPFILLGFAGFLMMIPLAITSTNDAIKKLGAKKWKTLHKLTYAIAVVTAIHYWLIVKSDIFYPAIFAVAFGLLLVYRFMRLNLSKSSRR